jgi:hypothetical protein
MRVIRNFISYIKAGCLLHLITLIEILVFVCLYYFLNMPGWSDTGDHVSLKLVAISCFVGMPLFAQLDARSRYQNYKLVKDYLYLYGFQTKILKPFMKSRCQRDAARAAAEELGLSVQCKKYFQSNGHKWYHLLPDILLKEPYILFTKNFWLTTLFTKTYHQKIDFEKLKCLSRGKKKLLFTP